MNFSRVFRLASIALLLCLVCGCSGFNRDWRKAAKTHPHGVEGRWEGTWTSKASNHDGKLRCILTQVAPEKYKAQFHAKYKKVLGFGYTATFMGTTTNDTFRFAGNADIGPLAGGIYTYEGRVNPTNFFSRYRSKHDHGIFEMQRPK